MEEIQVINHLSCLLEEWILIESVLRVGMKIVMCQVHIRERLEDKLAISLRIRAMLQAVMETQDS